MDSKKRPASFWHTVVVGYALDNRRRIIAVLVVGFITLNLVGGVVWWYAWHHRHQSEAKTTLPTAQQYNEAKQIANGFRNGTDASASQQANDVLSQNLTAQQRIGFLEQTAGELVRDNKPDEALQVYKQSEALQTGQPTLTVPTANGLMSIYADKGDKPQAIAYGQKLIAAVKVSKEPAVRGNLAAYESLVRNLEAGQ